MSLSFLDLRSQDDIASTLIQNTVKQVGRAAVFLRVSTCEHIKKSAFSYVCITENGYHIGSQILDKHQTEKQAFKHGLYRTIQNIKTLGIREINLFLVDEGLYLSLEGKSNNSELKFSGSVILVEEATQIAANVFLSYLNELYKAYIPPNGIKIKTNGLDEVLRWLEFIQGGGSFENHQDVPCLKELKNIYVEIIDGNKSVLIRYGILCWMVFDWLMRQEQSRNDQVCIDDIIELALNYYDYFHVVDTASVKINKMGLQKIELAKADKIVLVEKLLTTNKPETKSSIHQKIFFYKVKQEQELDLVGLKKQCEDVYRYHWALVQFKAKLFEQQHTVNGVIEQNVYHAVAKWVNRSLGGTIKRVVDGKEQLMDKAVFSFYLSIFGDLVDVDSVWALDKAVLVEQATMMIDGLDFSLYVEEEKGSESLCILNEVVGKVVKIKLNKAIELMKNHHRKNSLKPIFLKNLINQK